jgi:hypothetical protein
MMWASEDSSGFHWMLQYRESLCVEHSPLPERSCITQSHMHKVQNILSINIPFDSVYILQPGFGANYRSNAIFK